MCLALAGHHVVHWSQWRALVVLIVATVLMACCADLSTENIEPLLTHSSISQVFKMHFYVCLFFSPGVGLKGREPLEKTII